MKMGFLRENGAQSCCQLTEVRQWVRLANLSGPALLPSITYAASRKPQLRLLNAESNCPSPTPKEPS